jgi:hypothetical protein
LPDRRTFTVTAERKGRVEPGAAVGAIFGMLIGVVAGCGESPEHAASDSVIATATAVTLAESRRCDRALSIGGG